MSRRERRRSSNDRRPDVVLPVAVAIPLREVQDALERILTVPQIPRRIVSLVPSLTELVFDVGAGERIVGVSRYCTEPPGQLDRLPRVGGQKDPDLAGIIALRPDLVLAVREENLRRDIEALDGAGLATYVADVRQVEDAIALVGEIGDLVDGAPSRIAEIQRFVRGGVERARRRWVGERPIRVFAPVWRDPWLGVSEGTYMHDALVTIGAAPLSIGDRHQRYPKVTLEEVRRASPEAILLPDEPYPFGPADVTELALIAPTAIVDGKAVQWYGARTGRLDAVRDVLERLLDQATGP